MRFGDFCLKSLYITFFLCQVSCWDFFSVVYVFIHVFVQLVAVFSAYLDFLLVELNSSKLELELLILFPNMSVV